MAFNFFTAFHRALQDPEAYYSFQKEMNSKAVEQVFFNFYAGKTTFEAVVLPPDLSVINFIPTQRVLRVRPLDIQDFIIPEPCVFEGFPEKIKKVIDIHPLAYPEDNVPEHPTSETADVEFHTGEIVLCRLIDGNSFTLNYRRSPKSVTGLTAGFSCLASTEGVGTGEAKKAFANGGKKELSIVVSDTQPVQGKVSKGKGNTSGLALDWQDLKDISKGGLLNEVFNNIASHESGGNYDIYNLGACSDCGYPGNGVLTQIYGAELTGLTIQTVVDKVMKEKNINGHSVFATGKYQIVPRTLRGAIEAIKGCDTNEKYGKEQQDAFSAYLILMKRPTLGKYLLGAREITVENAQLAMAQEWAGIRVSGNHKRKRVNYNDKSYRLEVNLVPGESYYKNYDKYKWDQGTNQFIKQKDSNPDNIKTSSSNKTKAVLLATREKLLSNDAAIKLRKKLGIK
jgi:hypothetical protein